jgi:hypothetical protein
MPLAAQAVRCVEGCGEGTGTLAAIGLVVAMLSLGAALAAWKVSSGSLAIVEEEHSVFKAQLAARADFSLTIESIGGAIIGTGQPHVEVIWRLGVKNIGDRVANDVGINFLVPEEGIEELLWTDEAGTFMPQTASDRLKTSEKLPASDGTSWPAQYLATSVDRFTKSTHHVIHARAVIDCPPDVGETRIVPVKFKVWCDDLPDDVDARWETQELMLSRVAIS